MDNSVYECGTQGKARGTHLGIMAASMELNVQKWSVNIEEKIQDRVLGIFNILRLSLKEGTNLGT